MANSEKRLLLRVKEAIEQNRLKKAAEILDAILKANPNNDEAWVLAAEIIHDPQKRREYLNNAIINNPNNKIASRKLEELDKLSNVIIHEPIKIPKSSISSFSPLKIYGILAMIIGCGLFIIIASNNQAQPITFVTIRETTESTTAIEVPSEPAMNGTDAGPNTEPISIQGTVKVFYNSTFEPQQGVTVSLIQQSKSETPENIVAQTVSDEEGKYRFNDVPLLSDGDGYAIVACLTISEGGSYSGSLPSVEPAPTKPLLKQNIYMTLSEADCK